MNAIKIWWCNKKQAAGTRLVGSMVSLDWMVTKDRVLGSHDLASGSSIAYRNTPVHTHTQVGTHTYIMQIAQSAQMARITLKLSRHRRKEKSVWLYSGGKKGKWSETFLTGKSNRARDKLNLLEWKIWRAVKAVSLKLAGEKDKLVFLFCLNF